MAKAAATQLKPKEKAESGKKAAAVIKTGITKKAVKKTVHTASKKEPASKKATATVKKAVPKGQTVEAVGKKSASVAGKASLIVESAPPKTVSKKALSTATATKTAKSKSGSAKKVAQPRKAREIAAIRVSKILITQPRPDTDKSPYFDLARKFELELDFHPFIRVEGLSGKEFRKQRVDIAEHTAIVLNSRNAVDHFFRICEELKIKVSQDMKYFCITEAVALYLQKFILYRKRKVFFSADGSTQGLIDVLNKHKNNEKFLLPTTDSAKNEVRQFLQKHNAQFSDATLFRTVSNDITEVMQKAYDMIVFFSPFSVQTLFEQQPGFSQNGILIGAFGPTTSQAVEDSGLVLTVKAPAPGTPSMVAALEQFLAAQKSRP